MFLKITLGLFLCTVLAFSESQFVESLSKSKCSIHDGACQGALIASSLKSIQKTGIPELNVPPIDPLHFQDISVSIMDLVVLTAVDGTAKGVKNCVVDSFKTNIEERHSEMEMTCHSFSIKSKYKVSGSNPILKNLLGGETINGEGNGKVKIEKLHLHFDYFYDMRRNKDGDVYFHCKFNETQYDFKFLGKVTFAADDVRIGTQDATKLVVDFLNQNDRFIMSSFGKIFLDKAMQIVYKHSHNFFATVPAKNFIIEDLSQYVNE